MESPVTITKINLPGTVQKHFLVESLFEQIVTELNKIPRLNEFKMTNDATLIVCDIVENAITNNSEAKIDKKALVLRVLTQVFNLNPTEIEHVSRQIEFIHAGGMLVKEVVLSKSTIKKIVKFFLRLIIKSRKKK